jgi:hypothetical protein
MVAELFPQPEHLSWLTGPDVIRPDGTVASWVNPAHPGYAYPEIAGYMLSYLAQHGRATAELRNRVARHLATDMTPSGAVGRNGTEYVFDSAMVLAGLIAHVKAGGLLPEADMLDRLHEFMVSRLTRRVGIEGAAEAPATHWSASYGCHLLKSVISLTAYNDLNSYSGQDQMRAAPRIVETLLDDLLPLFDGARFHVNGESDATYTHAHCYALEGLLTLDGRGRRGLRQIIERGAEWLADIQTADGGVPSGYVADVLSPAHADCTAQSVRIWTCVDPERFAPSIRGAKTFLKSLTVDGGIRYRPGSEDINTWATIFGAQALDFAANGGRWEWLI